MKPTELPKEFIKETAKKYRASLMKLDDLLGDKEMHERVGEQLANYTRHIEQSRYELALLEIDLMPNALPKDALYAGLAVKMSGDGLYEKGSTTQKGYIDKMLKYCEMNSKYLKE